jgi:SAM-dependent methyltransferase
MPMPAPYDDFADVYDAWCASAPFTERNRAFYVEQCLAVDGPIVEVAAGDGRIALEVAARGRDITAVDLSPVMLERLEERARARGLAGHVKCICADARAFRLDVPAALVTIPFHSIGHLLTLDDKRDAFTHIHGQLAPGGRLVFDHFVFDPAIARRFERAPSLRAEYRDADDRPVMLWSTCRYDVPERTMRLIVWTDTLGADGVVLQRKYRTLDFSWIDPEQVRALLTETGYEIDDVHGGYDGEPFGPDAGEQVWFARRP